MIPCRVLKSSARWRDEARNQATVDERNGLSVATRAQLSSAMASKLLICGAGEGAATGPVGDVWRACHFSANISAVFWAEANGWVGLWVCCYQCWVVKKREGP